MEVTDERLGEIIKTNLSLLRRYKENAEIEIGFLEFICLMEELQSLRKIDIAYTLKYAEEAGAVCEEMKHGIEQVLKEIAYSRNDFYLQQQAGHDYGIQINTLRFAEDTIKKHLSKYLDLEE